MEDNPCIDCTRRHLYCHGRCEKEAKAKLKEAIKKEKIQKAREADNDFMGFITENRKSKYKKAKQR